MALQFMTPVWVSNTNNFPSFHTVHTSSANNDANSPSELNSGDSNDSAPAAVGTTPTSQTQPVSTDPNCQPLSSICSSSLPTSTNSANVAVPSNLQRGEDLRSNASRRDEMAASQEQRRQHRLALGNLEKQRDILSVQLRTARAEKEKEMCGCDIGIVKINHEFIMN